MAEAAAMTAGGPWPEVRLVISGFGGVICTFDYRIFCERLACRTNRTTDAILAAAFGDRLHADFETGRLVGQEYHRAVMARLRAKVPYDEFSSMYGDIFTEIPAACDLLRRLHTRYPLYLLSDTNEIHFAHVRGTVRTLALFDEFIVSYRVGMRAVRFESPAQLADELLRPGVVIP